ncbi:MAG TPA: non-canonical purine NTP pyrophosphatase, RdgB/HAM1 family [Opitutae bacterium]|nr:non-canonical purine NTP pyrophosphatase, RdgB/HAM1 family [Opitutae bacterium]|tara:strand:+ start:3581 stop:4198 length:618 start_codon:yes stop_codon:yes gene_type:complete
MKEIALYFASSNEGKLVEVRTMLEAAALPICVLSAKTAGGMPFVEENAPDYIGNARLKARALKASLGKDAWVLAEDSGLEVDALGGAPGIHTARYGSPDASSLVKCAELLAEVDERSETNRKARFVCVMILLTQDEEYIFRGECSGTLARNMLGEQGFGYDPIFIPDGHNTTFAELGARVKNKISHRAQALNALMGGLHSLTHLQ